MLVLTTGQTVRVLVATFVCGLFLTGCLYSDLPVLDAKDAQNVGDVLRYEEFSPSDAGTSTREGFRFIRENGVSYSAELVYESDQNAAGVESQIFSSGVLLRKLGKRGDDVVYLVQYDLRFTGNNPGGEVMNLGRGNRYLAHLVAIRSDGIGAVALIDCGDSRIVSLFKGHGADIICEAAGDKHDKFWSVFIENAPEAEGVAILEDLLKSGQLRWEDTEDYSIVSQVN